MGKVSDCTRCTRQGKQRIAIYHEHFHRWLWASFIFSTCFFHRHSTAHSEALPFCTYDSSPAQNTASSLLTKPYLFTYTNTYIRQSQIGLFWSWSEFLAFTQILHLWAALTVGCSANSFPFLLLFSEGIIFLYSWKVIVLGYGDDEQRITNRLLLYCDLSAWPCTILMIAPPLLLPQRARSLHWPLVSGFCSLWAWPPTYAAPHFVRRASSWNWFK